jgi:hypothetical protein
MTAIAAAALLATGVLCALPATADPSSGIYVVKEDTWQVDVLAYGWLPTLEGRTAFPVTGGNTFVIKPQTILDNIKMGFLGGVAVHKGDWGGFLDYIYLNVGDHRQVPLTLQTQQGPLVGPADVNFDSKSHVATLAGTYRALNNPELSVDLLAGARLLDLKQSLDVVGVGGGVFDGQSFHSGSSKDYWNGVVGARGRIYFGPDLKWILPFYADVGTGDSNLTWQLSAGFGYRFGFGDVVATYRYMDFQGKAGEAVQDLSFRGPLLGVALHW